MPNKNFEILRIGAANRVALPKKYTEQLKVDDFTFMKATLENGKIVLQPMQLTEKK